MTTTKRSRCSGRTFLMASATTISSEAADLMDAIASRVGPYTRKGRIEIAGQMIGLSPSQSRRLAYQEWKQVPAHVMDRLRELYTETCDALDESARQKIEANDAASEKRRRQRSCVDGEGDGPDIGLAECGGRDDDAQDPNVND